jgi:hypothetical protein
MNNRWSVYQYKLSQKTHQQRLQLYHKFCEQHSKLTERVKSVLYVVVVNLETQSLAATMSGLPKQVVNRIVRKYKDFLPF